MSFPKSKTLFISIDGLFFLITVFFMLDIVIEGVFLLAGGLIGFFNVTLLKKSVDALVGKRVSGKGKMKLFLMSASRLLLVGFYLYVAASISVWCLIAGLIGYLFPTFIMMLSSLHKDGAGVGVLEGR